MKLSEVKDVTRIINRKLEKQASKEKKRKAEEEKELIEKDEIFVNEIDAEINAEINEIEDAENTNKKGFLFFGIVALLGGALYLNKKRVINE